MKNKSLPGFQEIPIWDIAVFIIKELKRDAIITRANSMAFSFFLSIFPLIILIFTIITYIPIHDLDATMEGGIRDLLPETAQVFLFDSIERLKSIERGGVLSISFLMTFFFASNGMQTMLKGFEKNYTISFKHRNFIKQRLVALWLIFLSLLFLLVSMTFIVLSTQIANYFFHEDGSTIWDLIIFQSLKWFGVLILFYSIISIIYRYGPSLKQKLGVFSAGASVATVLSIFSSLIFSFFVNQFGRYSQIYGSIGAIIVMMLWIQINSMVILIGYEINASIAVNRDLRQSTQNDRIEP